MTTGAGSMRAGPLGAATDLDADAVLAVVRDAIVAVYEVDPASITRDTRLVEDLGADSLGLVEIVEIVESRLAQTVPGFRVDDDDLDDLTTVGVAVDYSLQRLAQAAGR
ncbi:MAG TPA: phosphopantetheine-binding protein [Mycobacteriales bacterium]|nr:phosphopantetheine-binding protein [Mycobacteriales bacterium]